MKHAAKKAEVAEVRKIRSEIDKREAAIAAEGAMRDILAGDSAGDSAGSGGDSLVTSSSNSSVADSPQADLPPPSVINAFHSTFIATAYGGAASNQPIAKAPPASLCTETFDAASQRSQSGVNFNVLEFSRTPEAFYDALDNDEDLSTCAAALRREGYVLPDGLRVFVDPPEYIEALPRALGLQSRHVLVSERYLETVLTAVRRIEGKHKVYEKQECRRDIFLKGDIAG